MSEAYIPLEIVAKYEDVPYNTLIQRMKRNPNAFKTREEPRESGKPRTLVAVSSLTSKARKLYRAERKTKELQGDDLVIDSIKNAPAPWYVDADYHWYMEHFPKQYKTAIDLADLMREFGDYCGDDRTGYAKEFAAAHGMTQRTLYRASENYLAASAWALKYERENGCNYDFFKVLALCRKPKDANKFPSLSPELKALIENIWFDQKFRKNLGTVQMLYTKLEEISQSSGIVYPSYPTVARYIQHLMEDQGGRSAAYLAERGTREWKNKMMVKGERDVKSIPVMGIVQGDEHTFDCWVSYTHQNGKTTAVRPKLVAWIDMRSRVIMGDVMCLDGNAQILKQSFIKLIYSYGVPEYILIDNGKDYTAKEMTGRDRNDRSGLSFDNETVGFYRSVGVKDNMRSKPYQPWSKAQIERFFGGVCATFTKWIDSYTGTLTASKTANKVKKDIDGMLANGELMTMDEFYGFWCKWLHEVYLVRVHSGLKRAGEAWTKPIELFENCAQKYTRPAPPESYAELLMMKSHRSYVSPVGIRRFKRTYMCEALQPYIGSHVDIKYNPNDTGVIYCYTTDGKKIGEAQCQELLAVGYRIQSEQLEEHNKKQSRHLRDNRDKLSQWTMPFEERAEGQTATPQVTGGYALTLKSKNPNKVVSLPIDHQYAQEVREKKRHASIRTDFYSQRGQAALDRIKKLG